MNERKINEKVDKMVREQISQILMLEYSIDRESFINRVYSLSPMIISYWCLIKHNRLIDDENYISHWKNEVGGWMLTLMNSKLKKNNSVEYKLKALTQAWEDLDYTTNPEAVRAAIYSKFNGENINPYSDIVTDVIHSFMSEAPQILSIIANENVKDLHQYINSL